jgi:AP2-like factor, ANT lineage
MKGTSDLSMLVGTTSGNGMEVDEQPKLEDFLGGTSGGYIFSNYSTICTNSNPNPNSTTNTSNNTKGGSTIGLSMIKTWLRNQPVPTSMQPQEGELSCADITNGTSISASQGLSLSMSTTETGSSMPLVPASIGGGETSSSENNNKQKAACVTVNSNGGLDAQSGAIEAVQRKSIDTFGQRTSIYRGVTR